MLIPLTCDAPVYHWPFATVGLIVANVIVFFGAIAVVGESEAMAETVASLLNLEHGNGIHPLQWFTSMFMHQGLFHLIGNMLFLWIFGLVVEGKLGWWKFLTVYLGIGVTQSALEQLVMLGMQGPSFSLGASSAIYGIMAIAVVWAPRNNISCFYWFFIWAMGTIEVPLVFLVLFYLAFDFLGMLLSYAANGNVMSTGFLHVTGALVGLPVGIVLLNTKLVDCEGWDIFHAWNGDDPNAEPDYTLVDEKVQERKKSKEQQHLSDAKTQFNAYLADDNVRAASALYKKMRHVAGGIELDRKELLTVIRGLHERQEWAGSALFMAELIERFPEASAPVRIKLAQICVAELQRPAKALELLDAIDFAQQPEKHLQLAKRIAKKAKQLQAEGVYELEEEAF